MENYISYRLCMDKFSPLASRFVGASPGIGRRAFLAGMVGAGALGLAACARDASGTGTLALSAELPKTVSATTSLVIAPVTAQLALRASGQLGKLPFTVPSWPNLEAGPDVIEAFRATALDLAENAGIPPIQAQATGLPVRIVAVGLNRKPEYWPVTAPGSDITSASQFRGRKLGFSQGQAQGVVLLRILAQAGISAKDVDLVALTSDQFTTALEARQVDVAVMSQPDLQEYLNGFAREGAHVISTNVVDYLDVLWSPVEVLEDEAKAAAIRAYIPFWAQSAVWRYENQATWIQTYYVDNQHLTTAQGELIVKSAGKPLFPTRWDSAITWEQETAKLLAAGGYDSAIDASQLFDRRFEGLASAAVPATYRS
jgi:sulfonate transport system substrate-binding protein